MSLLRPSSRVLSFLFAAGAALAACAQSDPVKCKVGADCASGICNADGTCEPVSTTTEGGGEAGSAGATSNGGEGGGGASGGAGGSGGDGGSGLCSPDKNGTITAEEVPLGAGLSAKFKVAADATFDTTGDKQGDGSRIWDFTVMLSGDQTVLAETLPIEGTWYAADFAGATYATRLSQGADLLGVFEVSADALLLRGVVSQEDGFTATNLSYDPPVPVLTFPMKEGDVWETTSTVAGLASGVYSFYTETYSSKVDAAGQAITPYAEFAVLRVGTDLTRVVGALVTTTRTYSFVTECFGSVATVVSQTNELGAEFTDAAEVRRLSP
jgi:hypothetical protein